MLFTVAAFVVLAVGAATPGLILVRGGRHDAGYLSAVVAASIVVSMLATAVLGVAWSFISGANLPAPALFPVSLALAGLAWLRAPRDRQEPAAFEWQGLAAAAVFAGYGALCYWLAFRHLADGGLEIHASYNADWFKHVAHVSSLMDYGVPAKDIFAGARPLHYYWLSYVLPGAAAAIGGDAWTAMYLANVLYAGLLMLVFYGLVRTTRLSPTTAAVVALAASVVTGPLYAWRTIFSADALHAYLTGPDAIYGIAPLSLYLPQHALALTMLLSWALLCIAKPGQRATRLLALVALASVLTISTLFGALLLTIYGLNELLRRRLHAVPEVAAMAIGSLGLVAVLGVLKMGDPTSSVTNRGIDEVALIRAHFGETAYLWTNLLLLQLGITFLFGLYLLYKLKAATPKERARKRLAALLIAVPFAFIPLTAYGVGNDIASEVFRRAVNLPVIGIALLAAWALSVAIEKGGRVARTTMAVGAAWVLLALPGFVTWIAWHGQSGTSFNTTVPGDDLAVMDALRHATPKDMVAWQYPENAFYSVPSGRGTWLPVFGARTVLASIRATDFPLAARDLELQRRFFAGEDVPIPAKVDAVYLSRTLTPATYDRLIDKMRARSDWYLLDCLKDACAFIRRKS